MKRKSIHFLLFAIGLSLALYLLFHPWLLPWAWGHGLDAEAFWRDRPIWLDAEAMAVANRHGRQWPPIPPDADTSWMPRNVSKHDRRATGYALDTGGPGYIGNAFEFNFWNHWTPTHPRPPDAIDRERLGLARSLQMSRRDIQSGRNLARYTAQSQSEHEAHLRKELIDFGYPSEAFTDEALFTDSPHWKQQYLSRLAAEGVDSSYIEAYCRAWNMTTNKDDASNQQIQPIAVKPGSG